MDALTTTGAKPILAALRRVLPWVLRRPTIVRPAVWCLVLALLLGAILAVNLMLAPLVLGVAIAALALVPVVALLGWSRLLRPGERPVVFLPQFSPATPGAVEASLNHQRALHRRLANGELNRRLELRDVPAAIGEREGERLLDEAGAKSVVCGEVEAAGDAATWRAVLLQAPPPGGKPPEAAPDRVNEHQRTRASAANRHELPVDYQVPLRELIGRRFEVRHAEGIEGTLLIIAAEGLLDARDLEGARACLEVADQLRASLSDKTRAHLEVARMQVDHPYPSRQALLQLERAGRGDAGHPDLWRLLASLALEGHQVGKIPVQDLVRIANEGVSRAPDCLDARYVLGHAHRLAGRLRRAAKEFDAVAGTAFFAEDYDFHMWRGVVNFNLERFEAAREAYRKAVALNSTARAHLYLADAHIRLNQVVEARHHYREALFIQPDLVDAHRGYWWKTPPGQDLKPPLLFDQLYGVVARLPGFGHRRWRRALYWLLLRAHYRRHPEDSRIHFMLGAHALLRFDLGVAEERLRFAYDLLDGVDTEALARLVLVHLQQGRYDLARSELEALHDAPSHERIGPPSQDELRRRLLNFYIPLFEEPRLARGEPGFRLEEMVEDVFQDVSLGTVG